MKSVKSSQKIDSPTIKVGNGARERLSTAESEKNFFRHVALDFCIRRIVNWAVAAQSSYPNFRILATKIDYKSAYRHGHLNAETALPTCTQLPDKGMAIVTFWNTFGRAPCPYEWGIKSETICNLANELIVSKEWNPLTLHATVQPLIPPKKLSPTICLWVRPASSL